MRKDVEEKGFKKWYSNHKDEFNKQRRERYRNDPEYKNRVSSNNSKSERVNAKSIVRSHRGKLTTLVPLSVMAANYTNGTTQRIRKWHSSGLIPQPTFLVGQNRYYTKNQCVLLGGLSKHFDAFGKMASKHKDFDPMIKSIFKHWED